MDKTRLHVAVALALLAPAAALAQSFDAVDLVPAANSGRFPAYTATDPRPTEWYVRGGVLRDNNVFRLGDAAPTQAILGTGSRSETVTRIGAGIRHEARVAGRQRVRLGANIDRYGFDRFSMLNHTAYGLRGEWLWEFTNDFSGTLGYERRRRLIDLAQMGRPLKDLVTEQHAFLTAAYAVGPRVRVRGGLDHARADRDQAAFEAADGRTNTVLGGIDYVTPLGNSAGIELRRTKGRFAIQEAIGGAFVDNDFTETEVAGVVTWAVSAQLRAVGRLGRTVRKHDQFSARDFRGTTGRATIDWTPLQKTGFEASIYKEPRSVVDIAASYVVVKGWSFGPRWAPTEKLVFSALLVNEDQTFGGDPTVILVAGTPQRDETVRAIRLGAAWEPVRFTKISLGVDRGHRSSNVALRDYDYTSLMANVELRF